MNGVDGVGVVCSSKLFFIFRSISSAFLENLLSIDANIIQFLMQGVNSTIQDGIFILISLVQTLHLWYYMLEGT